MTPEEIQFFDSLAERWDDNEVLSTPQKVSDILSRIGIREGMDILDLGTGTGVLLPFLSRITGTGGKIKAIDISEGMLGKARAKFGHLENVDFERKDFEKEQIEGKYDFIILYCVYPHLHTPRETLERLAAANLRPSGKIIIAFPSDENFINNIHKEKKAESDLLPPAPVLSSLLREWGFNSIVEAYGPDIYIVTAQRP